MEAMNRQSFRNIFGIFCLIIFSGCGGDEPTNSGSESTQPNILLIIADDMGKDATPGFTEGTIKPNTPNINNLAASGLIFTNFWVNPTCSPTRASIITGKYGYRTGVKWAGDQLSTSETILQKYISQQTNNAYATAVIGKWHLAGSGQGVVNPETFGMDYYAGLIGGAVQDYYQWELTENGETSIQTEYITKAFTDLSIDWIAEQNKPWFLWLAFNAPHTPFHVPPSEMHAQGSLPTYTQGMNVIPYYMAAIEAMDYQIGRLLESMSTSERENTIILFLGDNGTPNQAAQSPYSSNMVKGTLYEGGINTPLFISGSGVSRIGEVDSNLITSTDLFATLAQLAGSSTAEINDSRSFKYLLSEDGQHRDFEYSEMNDGTNDLWSIRGPRYKIITNSTGTLEMYDLLEDPYESNNLLTTTLSDQQRSAKIELESELAVIRN